jgi:hypothetical protein
MPGAFWETLLENGPNKAPDFNRTSLQQEPDPTKTQPDQHQTSTKPASQQKPVPTTAPNLTRKNPRPPIDAARFTPQQAEDSPPTPVATKSVRGSTPKYSPLNARRILGNPPRNRLPTKRRTSTEPPFNKHQTQQAPDPARTQPDQHQTSTKPASQQKPAPTTAPNLTRKNPRPPIDAARFTPQQAEDSPPTPAATKSARGSTPKYSRLNAPESLWEKTPTSSMHLLLLHCQSNSMQPTTNRPTARKFSQCPLLGFAAKHH